MNLARSLGDSISIAFRKIDFSVGISGFIAKRLMEIQILKGDQPQGASPGWQLVPASTGADRSNWYARMSRRFAGCKQRLFRATSNPIRTAT
jgi:hypothetical protein